MLMLARYVDAAARRKTASDRKSAIVNLVDDIACGYAGSRRPEMDTLLRSAVVEAAAGHPAWPQPAEMQPFRCRASQCLRILSGRFRRRGDRFDLACHACRPWRPVSPPPQLPVRSAQPFSTPDCQAHLLKPLSSRRSDLWLPPPILVAVASCPRV